MIPKKIHYFWFGKGERSDLEKECIARFARHAPNSEIIEWNEDNFDVSLHPYTAQAYKDKKWAFVSDYARLKILYEEGGIYLDTDMYLVRDISPLFEGGGFIGMEDDVYISAGIIGMVPKSEYIKDVLLAYDKLTARTPIPKVLTEVYNKKEFSLKVYEPEFFYPFTAESIKNFDKNNPPKDALAVHMWNYSWGSPLSKFVKKIGVYGILKKLSERVGIKNALKRVVKME